MYLLILEGRIYCRYESGTSRLLQLRLNMLLLSLALGRPTSHRSKRRNWNLSKAVFKTSRRCCFTWIWIFRFGSSTCVKRSPALWLVYALHVDWSGLCLCFWLSCFRLQWFYSKCVYTKKKKKVWQPKKLSEALEGDDDCFQVSMKPIKLGCLIKEVIKSNTFEP